MSLLTTEVSAAIPVIAKPTYNKQKCKRGIALHVDFDWTYLRFKPHLDTLRIVVPFNIDFVTAARPILTEILRTRVQILESNDGPCVTHIIVQDVTPSVLSELPYALKISGFGEGPFKIARLDIALDAFLRDSTNPEADAELRLKARDAIVRHLSVDLSITDLSGGGARWCKARGKRPTFCRTKRKALTDGPSQNYRVIDLEGSVYFGPKEGPLMYRIEHKTSDHRRKDIATPLENELCRVRIEIELSGERLLALGLGSLDQITGKKLTSLRSFFGFGCPILAGPSAIPLPKAKYEEELGHFHAAGLWAVQDRRRFEARSAKKRPSVDGIRRWAPDRTKREIALQPLNKQINKIFDRFGKSFDTHKRHKEVSIIFPHTTPGLSKCDADFMAAT